MEVIQAIDNASDSNELDYRMDVVRLINGSHTWNVIQAIDNASRSNEIDYRMDAALLFNGSQTGQLLRRKINFKPHSMLSSNFFFLSSVTRKLQLSVIDAIAFNNFVL
ncbi:hypothetical protein AVEN_106740-1 [Araneus ventricosus]|uniref:Uncharacterized protein n=1 Tax=Araneus ventricosus TaxID=182803 RepID=A0A4Y2D967_ARAVE|nr:hypothetical protein AVEN_106740-1 [Araneus ventricosus]